VVVDGGDDEAAAWIAEVRSNQPQAAVVAVVPPDEGDDVVLACLGAGANGVLDDSFSTSDLIRALSAAREEVFSYAARAAAALRGRVNGSMNGTQAVHLTTQERRVHELVEQGPHGTARSRPGCSSKSRPSRTTSEAHARSCTSPGGGTAAAATVRASTDRRTPPSTQYRLSTRLST
jgi:hypothetical protein